MPHQNIPTPPRLTGDPAQDVKLLTEWGFDLYKTLSAGVVEPVLKLGEVDDLAVGADLATTVAKVNEMLAAVRVG